MGYYFYVKDGLLMTVFLAVLFTLFQGYEYFESPFSIADGIYGSTFFMATGFHGFHVIIGTTFIIVCMLRIHHLASRPSIKTSSTPSHSTRWTFTNSIFEVGRFLPT